MSAKAGTIQGTQTGVPIGAWVVAVLLATMIAVALLVVNSSNRTSPSAPITTTIESTVPVGFSHVAPTAEVEPWQPIIVSGSACNQCR